MGKGFLESALAYLLEKEETSLNCNFKQILFSPIGEICNRVF